MRVLSKLLWGTSEIHFSSVTVNLKEKLEGNSMTVQIENPYEILSNSEIKFKINDRFDFFAKTDYTGSGLDTSATSVDLLFSGTLKSIKLKTENKFRCTLEFVDSTYSILNKLWSKNYEGFTAPQIIHKILEFVSDTGEGNIITFPYDNTDPYTSGIQNKRPNGTDFPIKPYGNAHKPVFEFIEDLSQVEYTNYDTELSTELICTRPFKYYIDRQNVFHWFYPTDTPNYEFEYGATDVVGSDTTHHRILSEGLTLSQLDEINFIIFKAGEDMDNVQILDYDLDATAESLTTADSFRNWESIAKNMKIKDASNLTFVKSQEYDYPATYPVIPKWDTKGRSVTSDSEYNDNFREIAIAEAKNKCKSIFNATGDPRWKGKIKIKGENIKPTELIKYINTKLGINRLLRVKGITHNITKGDYTSTLDIQEDEKEILQVS